MKLPPDPELLDRVRRLPCAVCKCPAPSEAAHIFTKGMGGWSRYDIPVNVLPLCMLCHRRHHDGHEPGVSTLLHISATWAGTTARKIHTVLQALRNAAPGSDPKPILGMLNGRRTRLSALRRRNRTADGSPAVQGPAGSSDGLRLRDPRLPPVDRIACRPAHQGGWVEL